jgi:thymidine kinase
MNTAGRLELVIGNMFSGKTSELIRRINRQKSINKRILVVNYIGDNRYSCDSVVSHDNHKIASLKLKELSVLTESMVYEYDSFFIDEAQFFPDLFDTVLCLVDVHNKNVVVSGLDGDTFRNSFGEISKLIPICDTVDKLSAYCCKCNNGNLAPFTQKKTNNTSVNTSVVDIGGSDKYIPVCRYHYLNHSVV